MNEKILLVDDEVAILEGYQRLLRREFSIDVAVGGKGALIAFEANGPYAVVVSDMRMPEMDGAQLLAKIRVLAPDTVRVMLTGNADIQTAVSAVNEGNIFRFLTKPCTKETLAKALTASLVQARLVNAEKDLLENTLKGSIQVFSEVLSLVNPAAFSRAMRLRRYMQQITKYLLLGNPWRFEVAAMMSQLGCVMLAPETLNAVYAGRPLPAEEQGRFDAHPKVAHDLLGNIPRLEPIAWMIAHQNTIPGLEGNIDDREMADMRLGAELLHLTIEYDDLLRTLNSRTEALHRLSLKHRGLDPRISQALLEIEPGPEEKQEARPCPIAELTAGMVLADEVRTTKGALIADRDHEMSAALILKLKMLHAAAEIGEEVMIRIAKERAAAARS